MASRDRQHKPTVTLSHEGEWAAAEGIAGPKGPAEVVKPKGRQGRRRRRQGKGGHGTREQEPPPVCGLLPRCGPGVITMMAIVQSKTIEPLSKATMTPAHCVAGHLKP